jgi:hypothetical protein
MPDVGRNLPVQSGQFHTTCFIANRDSTKYERDAGWPIKKSWITRGRSTQDGDMLPQANPE